MLTLIVIVLYGLFSIPLVRGIVRYAKTPLEQRKWRWGSLWFFLIGGVLLTLVLSGLRIYTDAAWFSTLGYLSVFLKRFLWQVGLYWGVALISFLFLFLNLKVVQRCVARFYKKEAFLSISRRETKIVEWGATIAVAAIALLLGFWARGQWNRILLYINQVSFNLPDPIFSKDVGFYIFSLPVYRFIMQFCLALVFLALIAVLLLYQFYRYQIGQSVGRIEAKVVSRQGLVHGSVLLAIIIGLLIWERGLAMYGLVCSGKGLVSGASYTDVVARILTYKIYMVLLGLIAVMVLWNIFRFRWRRLAGIAGLWFLSWLILIIIWPACVQQFSVKPNEITKETPYLRYDIAFTQQAYRIDSLHLEEKEFEVAELTSGHIQRNPSTIDNIRLWDWRALLDTYQQIQAIRLYYQFYDVDLDRYIVKENYRQVMLAARELNKDLLPLESKTWINLRFKYTHGYGLCLNAVNEFSAPPEGLPILLIKDMPPTSGISELRISRPEIYFGEMTLDHVFVKTTEKEFDYPKGDQNIYCYYKGQGGVRLGRGLLKLAFALRFDGIKLLLSSYLGSESRIMFHRSIKERVKTIAPFLLFDHDPYLVIGDDGRLYWIWDAYTICNSYPYSRLYRGYPDEYSSLNYIRNSCKVVIDAYNGSVCFYIFDEGDPIIKTYEKIFPALFKGKEEMPTALLKHIRYPEDILTIQAEIYATYHMREIPVFYNKEDLWEIAEEMYVGEKQRVLPYYVTVQLPDEEREEFVQMVPFTPTKKNNMIGWMAGRCDEEHYGRLLVYKFPKQLLIYGPMQIEARIDQDAEISKALTLWGQMGSQVIRGNLLVIPVEKSLLYIEPLYLQAEQAKMPQLKKVVMATAGRLTWGDTFREAMENLFATEILAPAREEVLKVLPEQRLKELIQSADHHYRRYLELTGQGRVEEAGKELNGLGKDLKKLLQMRGL